MRKFWAKARKVWRILTHNTAYYIEGRTCVRAEPVQPGAPALHEAVGAPLLGGYFPEQRRLYQVPQEIPAGARLLFDMGANLLRTSPVQRIEEVTI